MSSPEKLSLQRVPLFDVVLSGRNAAEMVEFLEKHDVFPDISSGVSGETCGVRIQYFESAAATALHAKLLGPLLEIQE